MITVVEYRTPYDPGGVFWLLMDEREEPGCEIRPEMYREERVALVTAACLMYFREHGVWLTPSYQLRFLNV